MEYLALLIPVFVSIFLFLFFRKETVWWEYTLLLIPTIIIFFSLKAGMISYSQSDTEYRGFYVTGAKYYEPWNEYIHRTCTRTVGSGKNQRTETYDCSYVQYHSADWVVILNDDREISVKQSQYDKLLYLWNMPRKFIDMHRYYHTQDGDAYYTEWNGVPETTMNITTENSYVNKIKASKSVFSFEDLTKEEFKEYNLVEYPKTIGMYQPTIISKHKIDQNTINAWDFMNSYNGKKFQFRSYLIFYYNQSPEIVNKQLSWWKGVNKNEMNIFISLDSTTLKKQWVRVVSWSDRPVLDVDMRDYINEMDSLDINLINKYLTSKIASEWNRKEFKDFDYIKVDLTDTQINWLFILLLIYNIGISIFIIKNEFTNNDNYNFSNYNK